MSGAQSLLNSLPSYLLNRGARGLYSLLQCPVHTVLNSLLSYLLNRGARELSLIQCPVHSLYSSVYLVIYWIERPGGFIVYSSVRCTLYSTVYLVIYSIEGPGGLSLLQWAVHTVLNSLPSYLLNRARGLIIHHWTIMNTIF